MTTIETPAVGDDRKELSRFLRLALILSALVLAIPTLIGIFGAPAGSSYLGEPYNTDDHMVYAAWIHQAAQGHFFMDNRFAVDQQPGLTVNVYFFAVGQLARFVGIPIAANLFRVGFSLLFVYLSYRLVRRFGQGVYFTKLGLVLTLVGGGIGFLVWHEFGRQLILDHTVWLQAVTLGALPIDVWQPEAFVFPSLLTNGLFAVSLCLILTVFQSVLDLQEPEKGWRPILLGAIAIGVLMNIHSYDVLLIGLVLTGLLVASVATRSFSWPWLGKVCLLLIGILPGAFWFVHVISSDPVFAQRAATQTYAANFRALFVGCLPLTLLGFVGLFARSMVTKEEAKTYDVKKLVGLALSLAVYGFLFFTASSTEGYAVNLPTWGLLFVAILASVYCLAEESPVYNLVLAWALIALIAPYFPQLFQRKLAMGLEIPWSILSALTLKDFVLNKDRGTRNLATALALLILGGSSVRWMVREFQLIRGNVSETTVQPVYLNRQSQEIVDYLDHQSGRSVVLCLPGGASPAADEVGHPLPDSFMSPVIADLNPILSGLAGVYTYAGHWSETPDYAERRSRLLRSLYSAKSTVEERQALIQETNANYIVAPIPEAYADIAAFADLSTLGKVVVKGSALELIEVKKP